MGSFRIWLESEERNDQKIREIYNEIVKEFTGLAGKSGLNNLLSDINKDEVGGKRGAKAALDKLNDLSVKERLSAFGEDWTSRWQDTEDYLGTGTKVGTVGKMLEMLFGNKHREWAGIDFAKPESKEKSYPPEEDNAKIGQDSTAEPMAGQEPPPEEPPPEEMPPEMAGQIPPEEMMGQPRMQQPGMPPPPMQQKMPPPQPQM